jgi:hypothetical protein
MTHSLEPTSSYGGDSAGRSSWRWRYEDATGAEVAPAEGGTAAEGVGFPSQSDAESWIGEVWRDLLDEGVEQVTLFEADRLVYGPMSLQMPA